MQKFSSSSSPVRHSKIQSNPLSKRRAAEQSREFDAEDSWQTDRVRIPLIDGLKSKSYERRF
jgi:hypothetical protein